MATRSDKAFVETALEMALCKGELYDIALMESVFATLKAECVERHDFHTIEQARTCQPHTSGASLTRDGLSQESMLLEPALRCENQRFRERTNRSHNNAFCSGRHIALGRVMG
jgi:hypothetical protein